VTNLFAHLGTQQIRVRLIRKGRDRLIGEPERLVAVALGELGGSAFEHGVQSFGAADGDDRQRKEKCGVHGRYSRSTPMG
jgi:hypothetical protein